MYSTINGVITNVEKERILRVEDLKKYFPLRAGIFSRIKGFVRAVDGICLNINRGETYGLVGESGSGKTTLGLTILRLTEPTSGQVFFKKVNIIELNKDKLRNLRMKLQIIFQDPYGSLNPRMSVGESIGESLGVHGIARGEKKREIVEHTLNICGLLPYHYNFYPHQFSGGQRQRIAIARALVLQPEFIVADEPVSALDVSTQAQIINLLEELQDKFKLTYLFISHDLSIVKHIADQVGVMYLGNLVEEAKKVDLYHNPCHPYTRALLSAIPVMDPTIHKKRIILKGDIPSTINPPSGCTFHPRCPQAMKICREVIPELKEVTHGHRVACHLFRR
ncbi:MAG: ABC transporter ATP-binding protein [Promethearchaeota archaeon]